MGKIQSNVCTFFGPLFKHVNYNDIFEATGKFERGLVLYDTVSFVRFSDGMLTVFPKKPY